MKRRYKKGDWFRVPLDARHEALGVITHACRSRLFGYFFAGAPHRDYGFAVLKSLRAGDACARLLFGAEPIETLRWPLVATSLNFDAAQWPLPNFASRSAFGRRWSLVAYDPVTLQACAKHWVDRDTAAALPPAHVVGAAEAEDRLRTALAAGIARRPSIVCEIRTPVDAASLHVLRDGGRVQSAQALTLEDVRTLVRALGDSPVELRVHGMHGRPFDASVLASWPSLSALIVDTPRVTGVSAIGRLHRLRRLRVPAALFAQLPPLPGVDDLEVFGSAETLDASEWTGARRFTVAGARTVMPPVRVTELVLRHAGAIDLPALAALPALETLEIDAAALVDISALCSSQSLRVLTLRNVRLLTGLDPLCRLPRLREIRLLGMPQLGVRDFRALRARGVRAVVESGDRTKDREVYRLFAAV